MIVPQYWAESRLQRRERGRQVTVRRFGWSDASQAAAQSHADERARESLERILAGQSLNRREPKVPYNGAEGVPIREEIVARHGPTLITRNSYGALCLNTPNVLFADIDFPTAPSCRFIIALMPLLFLGALAMGVRFGSLRTILFLMAMAPFAAALAAGPIHRVLTRLHGGAEAMALRRVRRYAEQNQDWSLRPYRTPAGLRVLATHRTFAPDEQEVGTFFRSLCTDSIYVRMCTRQQCFRARVSPKPWRIGISSHMRPRPGTWPVAPEKLEMRTAWIAEYERQAEGFAACAFLESLGSGVTHREVQSVIDLHDALCHAQSGRPLG